ncbi:MAG: site-specific integrase [Deltaproteobacteria bacterium]|nr:site-specific integrase [Deltaproteobacteria bacterium]
MARKKRKRPHGMGCAYERSPGNWWIKWPERGETRHAHGYQTREEAERVLSVIVANVKAERDGLPVDYSKTQRLGDLAPKWLDGRAITNRAIKTDRSRWRKHLAPAFGKLRPAEIDAARLRRYVEQKLASGLNPSTVGHTLKLLSSFFSYLCEEHIAPSNPVSTLPRATRRLFRSKADPKLVPFLERADQIERVFAALPEPFNAAFAIGALAGLRTGEVLGLEWRDFDFSARRITVSKQARDGRLAPLKDDESRVVPIQRALEPILAAWRLKTGGNGLLFTPAIPTRGGTLTRKPTFVRPHTLNDHLRRALTKCKLPRLTWYQATRHTFASHWVLNNGSMEKLATVMGHSSTTITERYAHMRSDLFRDADYEVISVKLGRAPASVASIAAPSESGTDSYVMVTRADSGSVGSSVSD